MPRFEYKVVPAPARGLKGKGIKSPEARFSHALETLMNDLAGQGWEFQRAETLPATERAGLTGSSTEWRHMLVFRRPRGAAAETAAPDLLPPPAPETASPAGAAADTTPEAGQAPSGPANAADPPWAKVRTTAENSWQHRITDTSDASPVGAPLQKLTAFRKKPQGDD